VTREAVAVAQWHARLSMTRNRCLYEAEQSLEAAAHNGRINRPCQQKDARIFFWECAGWPYGPGWGTVPGWVIMVIRAHHGPC
jgi:hypothetical protein